MLRTLAFGLVCFLQISFAFAQSAGSVSGRVVDEKGQIVIGATVLVAGSAVGTATNTEGAFLLSAKPTDKLLVSFIGYQPTTVPVNSQSNLTITLKEDATTINEVVVTALGLTRESKSLSYNVQKIGGDDLVKTKDANIMSSLAGKVAGVQINSSAAGIGGGARVVMRGAKSISGNNNALYVIDGIPLSNLTAEQPSDRYTGAGQTGDAMSNINADDIESISVLNGSAAAALYGSAAANGVVLITTKKGSSDQTSVSYSNNSTFYSPFMLPKFQNTYGSETGEWYSWGGKLNNPSTYDVEHFLQTGYNVANTVSLSTGNAKNQTYVSAGSVNARGMIQNNELDRYTFSVRNTSEFLKGRMSMDLSAMYASTSEQNMLSQGEYANPLVPTYLFPRGDDIEKYKYYERYDVSRNIKTMFWPLGDNGLSMQNPWWITNRNMYTNNKDRYLFGASLKYKITDWMNVSGRVKYDKDVSVYERKIYASSLSVLAENSNKGAYVKNNKNTTQLYADAMVNINKYFFDNNLNLTAAVGGSMQKLTHREESIGGGLKTLPNLFTYTNVDTSGKLTFKQNDYRERTNSLFATVSLGYKGMAYIDASLRNDWISTLAGTNNTSILYPSVGATALLTDIFGMQRNNTLSMAKIRVSYSEVGNAPERFRAITTYSVLGGLNTTSYFPAYDLQPERTRSWEAGVNLAFFNNKLTLDVTAYRSQTENQLFSPTISSTTGFTKLYVNAGKVSNKGLEVALGYKQNLGPVRWNTNVLWSMNRNRVDQLLPDYTNEELGVTVRLDNLDVFQLGGAKQMLTVGGTMGDIYVNTMRTDEHGYIWVDSMTGNIETQVNNWVKAGTSNPDGMLSWRNNFDWKGLSLGFMLTARIGGVGVSGTQAVMDYYGVSEDSANARANGGVDVNGYKIDAQKWYQTVGGNGANYVGSMYVYSMTNIRLGELTLGYDIPVNKWCKWIKGLNVSFVGRNLCMLYCKAPFDPEATASIGTYNQGFDYFMQPSMRSLGFSVKATF